MSEETLSSTDGAFVSYGERRVRDGIYDAIIDMELAMGPDGLGQIEPHVTLPLAATFLDNMAFVGPDSKPFPVQLLGEFAPGTNVEPTGTHNAPKGELRPINDKSRVKWNWSLQCPDGAPDIIRDLFHNQVTTLHNAIDPEHASPTTKTWATRFMRDEQPDLIHMGTERIYKVPKYSRAPVSTPNVKMVKKPLFAIKPPGEPTSPTGSTSSTLSSDGGYQSPVANRKAGDLLNPSVLTGYGGGWFDHTSATRLVQLDIRDPNGDLIHPQDWWKWIVEGNLVFATAEMHLYDIDNRKTHSLVMKSLQILDRSDAVPVMPQQRIWDPQVNVVAKQDTPPPSSQSPSKYSPGSVRLPCGKSKGKKRALSEEAGPIPKTKIPKKNANKK
ncbi:hypothetical protein K435DRAFT_808460 [Dendrothele bispora CBS 962.96]|uniref:Uncharacterized protein n=1 Tax=Dendrothele bispora (strain CBS 962.96) TaxID=1314807 RepID=A0A4S8L1T9_DENBC|nr:hypothetical protein K435DRAFT_808460 [Dendrothele bispora CBS 962.96]